MEDIMIEKTIVEIKDLVKRYKELVALDHFNLEIKEGEIFGLLGPNGSGKSTTINCLLGLLKYDKGSIKVFGETIKPNSYELKKKVGVVFHVWFSLKSPADVATFELVMLKSTVMPTSLLR